MTWWICSNIKFSFLISVVEYVYLITYLFLIRLSLNAPQRNPFPLSYAIILFLVYIHIVACFSFYHNTSNHLVVGTITVKYFCMRGSSWPPLIILYGHIISTNNMYHGMDSSSFTYKWPCLRFYFLLFLQVSQILLWVHMPSFKFGQ